MLSFPVPWLLWLLLAAILILPVLLRLYAGEEPDNAVRHESGGGDGDQGPDGLLAAA